MINKRTFSAVLASSLTCMLMMTACNKYSPDSYTPDATQQANKTERATIKSFRQVDIHDPKLGLGALGGGVAGGVLGSQIGEGKGSVLAAVGGVVVGAVAGAFVENKVTENTAYEYVLEKPNGDLITLAQKQDKPFAVGSHVLIVYGKQSRVIEDTTSDTPVISK